MRREGRSYLGGHSILYDGSRTRYEPRRQETSAVRPVMPFVMLGVLICAVIILLIILKVPHITASTVKREPLPDGTVALTGWYEDHLDLISSPTELEKGMKHFYQKTGVQPFLYTTPDVDGDPAPTDITMGVYAASLYDELFEDGGHLLLIFQEFNSNGNYMAWCTAGEQARTVIDAEAVEILLDYVDHYYGVNMGEKEFSSVFTKAADRIMRITIPLPLLIIVPITAVAGVLIFLKFRKKRKRR